MYTAEILEWEQMCCNLVMDGWLWACSDSELAAWWGGPWGFLSTLRMQVPVIKLVMDGWLTVGW